MEETVQQCVCINFCFHPGKTGAEMYEMLHAAFGESCLIHLKTFEWYSRFKNWRRSFEDDPRPGRPSTSHTEETVARVWEIIRADQRLTIREVAEDVGIAFGTCQKILTEDLQMRRASAIFVPRLLTVERKDDRVSVCTDLRELAQNDLNFMSSVITGDESWIYGYDPETKQMSSQWKTASSPRPKKAQQVKSNVKTMLITFFDIVGLVHHEYVPRSQTVNKEFYKTVLQRFCDAVCRHHPEKWHSVIGSCTMTMPLLIGLCPQMNFWRNTTFCPSHTLLTPLTLLRATSSCSCNWRKQWKVADLMTRRVKPMRRDKWGLLQKVTTRGAFISGRNTGISAYKQKDTTSKATRLN